MPPRRKRKMRGGILAFRKVLTTPNVYPTPPPTTPSEYIISNHSMRRGNFAGAQISGELESGSARRELKGLDKAGCLSRFLWLWISELVALAQTEPLT